MENDADVRDLCAEVTVDVGRERVPWPHRGYWISRKSWLWSSWRSQLSYIARRHLLIWRLRESKSNFSVGHLFCFPSLNFWSHLRDLPCPSQKALPQPTSPQCHYTCYLQTNWQSDVNNELVRSAYLKCWLISDNLFTMGYDVTRFAESSVDEELLCPICSGVLENPRQVEFKKVLLLNLSTYLHES